MTNKEAIEILDQWRNIEVITETEACLHIALTMAIKALEQEETLQNLTEPNKSDLISRQEACKIWEKAKYQLEHLLDFEGGIEYGYRTNEQVNELDYAIEVAKTALSFLHILTMMGVDDIK